MKLQIFPQMPKSVILSYFDAENMAQERFLYFINVSSDKTADALSQYLIETVKTLKCEEKIISQCYDGAAVMWGELNGSQSKVRKI